MSSLFPRRSSVDEERDGPRVVRVDEADAGEVFGALGSDTARSILGALYEEPRTASEVAEAADTSLQNARYHLEKLLDAELVEIVDTWYSDRGTEMKVYAPQSDSVVVFAGEERQRSRLRAAVERVIGGVGIVAANLAVVDALAVLQRLVGAVALVGVAGLLVELFLPGGTPAADGEYTDGSRQDGAESPSLGQDAANGSGIDPAGAVEPLVTLSPTALLLLGAVAAAVLVFVALVVVRRRG